jgi:hypothetical protein
MTIIGYQHDDSCLPDREAIEGLTSWPICPCRPGAHVWLWSSSTASPDATPPEGTPCACGQMKWHTVEPEPGWREDVLRRLAEIERRLDGH